LKWIAIAHLSYADTLANSSDALKRRKTSIGSPIGRILRQPGNNFQTTLASAFVLKSQGTGMMDRQVERDICG
jgi:hypothetical protein